MSSFKSFSFDNESVISHQKVVNSWLLKALIIPYILCKISEIIWYTVFKFSEIAHYSMQFASLSTLNTLFSVDWLENDDLVQMR